MAAGPSTGGNRERDLIPLDAGTGLVGSDSAGAPGFSAGSRVRRRTRTTGSALSSPDIHTG